MLRHYSNLTQLSRDLQTINSRLSYIMAAVDDNDDDVSDDIPEVRRATMRQGKQPITQRLQPGARPNREYEREVVRHNKKLTELLEQQKAIDNILNLLQTEFAGTQTDDATRMQKLAKRIQRDVGNTINNTKKNLSEISQRTIPPLLIKISNSIKQKLNNSLSRKAASEETTHLMAMVDGFPQYTVYLIYHNVKSDTGNIAHVKIIAISLYQNKLYINPAEAIFKPPGQFNRGLPVEVDTTNLSRTVDSIMKRVNAQLVADDQVSAVLALPLPFAQDKINLAAIEHVRDFSIKDGVITVRINKSVGNEAKAIEVLNRIHTYLFSLATMHNPRGHFRIDTSKPILTSGSYRATLKFTPGGKFSGETLERDLVTKLRNLGLPDRKIHRLIEED